MDLLLIIKAKIFFFQYIVLITVTLRGQSHKKVGKMRVWDNSLGPD
jgi:hypothetical protein